jgi:hypothetical protein
MANDHFISQFLTRRWEVQPGRTLHFFDFGGLSRGAEAARGCPTLVSLVVAPQLVGGL